MAYITKQSRAVLRCLESRETLSAAELAETLRRQGETVGLATVYRQLERQGERGQFQDQLLIAIKEMTE